MPVTMLVAPGPDVAIATPDLATSARVSVGHVCGALLVPNEDVADGIIEHRVVGGKDRTARISEHGLDAFSNECLPDNLCAGSHR